jgi:hypothetical protein
MVAHKEHKPAKTLEHGMQPPNIPGCMGFTIHALHGKTQGFDQPLEHAHKRGIITNKKKTTGLVHKLADGLIQHFPFPHMRLLVISVHNRP